MFHFDRKDMERRGGKGGGGGKKGGGRGVRRRRKQNGKKERGRVTGRTGMPVERKKSVKARAIQLTATHCLAEISVWQRS